MYFMPGFFMAYLLAPQVLRGARAFSSL
jgi:hypothetical protein